MDLAILGISDVRDELERAAEETAAMLGSGVWDPIQFDTRETFRHRPEGVEAARDPSYGEAYVTGRWLATVSATCERNRSRFQSLLQSACIAVEAGMPCADLLVGHLLDKWGWPGDRPMPETAVECIAVTKHLIRVPEQLDVSGYAAELREARRSV